MHGVLCCILQTTESFKANAISPQYFDLESLVATMLIGMFTMNANLFNKL